LNNGDNIEGEWENWITTKGKKFNSKRKLIKEGEFSIIQLVNIF